MALFSVDKNNGSRNGGASLEKGESHFSIISEYLNITFQELAQNGICLGDGIRDIKVAKKYEFYAIGITNTHQREVLKTAGANIIVDDYYDLISYFSEDYSVTSGKVYSFTKSHRS